VFGLKPGVSTLGEVGSFGSAMEFEAIIAEPNEVGTLEGYYSQVFRWVSCWPRWLLRSTPKMRPLFPCAIERCGQAHG
jgi:hypothetical protein